MASRKLRLRGSDQRIVLGFGVLAGVGLALRGLSPTGSTVTDWILLIAAATGAVWAASTAPWWALSGLAALAAAIAERWVPTVIGVALFVLSLAVGAVRRSQPVERAAIAGGALLVLSTAQELGRFGINSLVAIGAVAVVAGLGLWRRSRRDRKIAFVVLGVAATVAVIAGLGLLVAGLAARPHLSEGNRVARQGLQQMKEGEFEAAQTSFDRAADAFGRADSDLGAVWVQPARLVPIASQHREAGVELSGAAADATRTIEEQLTLIDFDRLKIVDGAIDVAAVESLQAPMNELQAALDDLDEAAVDAYSAWLVESLRERLFDLRADIADQQALGAKANAALAAAPSILGAEGERVYFVMFTTPAEARGTGGFMGNYAEVTIDGGRIEVTAFGRHTDLNREADGELVLHDPPPDWLARYGDQGFAVGADGEVAPDIWSTFNMSPHFPYSAGVVADFYPQSGGTEIDGVINLDVYALETLIGLVGPITLEDGTTLDGTNTAQYLLVDQYRSVEDSDDNAERVDQLEVIAFETVNRLLSTNPPDPIELGKAMAPMVRERRTMAWLRSADEQAIVESVSMDGGLLLRLDGRDGLAVVAVNDGGNKLDTYLGRSMTVSRTATGDRLEVTVSHDAPVDQMSSYAVGEAEGLPEGWTRVWLTLNTTRPVASAALDGEPVSVSYSQETGIPNYGIFLELAPGSSQTVTFEIIGRSSESGLVVQPQPLVRPEQWTVDGVVPPAELNQSAAVR